MFPLLKGASGGKLEFPPESAPLPPPVLTGLRPEAEELGRLWSKRTAMPRETTACQLPLLAQSWLRKPLHKVREGGQGEKARLCPLVRDHSLSLALAGLQRERGDVSCPCSSLTPRSLLLLSQAREREEKTHISKRGIEAEGMSAP